MKNTYIAARAVIAAWILFVGLLTSGCGDDSNNIISGSPAATATVGKLYTFTPKVSTHSGTDPSFSITNQPGWAKFDATTGTLSGTPSVAEVGVFSGIQISVSLGKTRQSLQPFSITVAASAAANAANAVTLVWDAPTQNADGSSLTDLAGYKIYYGDTSGNYSSSIQVSNAGITTYVVENLPPGQYYFAMTAYDTAGEESEYSSEVSTAID